MSRGTSNVGGFDAFFSQSFPGRVFLAEPTCFLASESYSGYIVENSSATTVSGLGRVSCDSAAHYVPGSQQPSAHCRLGDLSAFHFTGCVLFCAANSGTRVR
eukprot:COSAG01_NODE_55293_length_326_cov_0.687225_1_plen_101_part_01